MSVAQGPTIAPQFEVASIRPVTRGATDKDWSAPQLRVMIRDSRRLGEIPMLSPDRISLKDWTILDLIAAAYSVRPAQVLGPDWMKDQSFDVEATVPVGTPTQTLNAMLRSLLKERFGLQAHSMLRTSSGFALIVGKGGPRLESARPLATDAKQDVGTDAQAKVEKAIQADMASTRKRMEELEADKGNLDSYHFTTMPSVTTEELAARLVRYTGAPVIDATGLTGRYRVTIEVYGNGSDSNGSVFEAVEKLGLRLESRKLTTEAVMVDRVYKIPTSN